MAGTILVVEDDFDIREAVRELLEGAGHSTAAASNGREALELLRCAPRPGLVLLDLMMPEVSGHQVLETLSRDVAFAGLPVVVFSAQPGRVRGASAVLCKPFGARDLLRVVADLLLPLPPEQVEAGLPAITNRWSDGPC